MIRGSFEIWEFVVLVSSGLILVGGFALNISPEIAIFTGFLTMTATLFVRPVWLLVNRGRINNWEHVTAEVVNRELTKVRHRNTTYYRVTLTLRFKDGMSKEYNESFTAPAFMRGANEGNEYEIAFDPKHPDKFIALKPAHEQAVLMTILGIILETAMTALCIFAYIMDNGG